MKALNRQATGIALGLCRDAYGNLLGGQEARAFGYLRHAIQLLAALDESAESKGDIRAEKALQAALKEALEGADNLEPAFDHSLVADARARYEAMGITGEGVLPSIDPNDLPEDHPLRQIVADLTK
ncbi:hypothetical protein BOC40_06570 [Burkholderia pseudomallei]|uniref:hypothetical protein n=1 Tax=Burkholderia pseudomallei TaxID=28450 RepID=UPI000A1A0264|nr:hypothetical protein [Burkholderia pseudomallei]ARK80124.1 hypothetical protein BOC40_06570 [Burkholderia pseudomallei]ARL46289.1 hypothetical protein BOC50_25330 [Burkholderia pseudomallei]